MLKPKSLQNYSWWGLKWEMVDGQIFYPLPKNSIYITPDDPFWAEVYANWLDGKKPTESPLWKDVIMTFKEVDDKILNV